MYLRSTLSCWISSRVMMSDPLWFWRRRRKNQRRKREASGRKSRQTRRNVSKGKLNAALLKGECLFSPSGQEYFLNPNTSLAIQPYLDRIIYSSFIFFSMEKHKEIRENLKRGGEVKVSIEEQNFYLRTERIFRIFAFASNLMFALRRLHLFSGH